MSRKYIYFFVCIILSTILVGAPLPSDKSASVLTDRLVSAMENEGPWTVWVYFQDKGLEGSDLERALETAEADLDPRAARRRAKVVPQGLRLVDEADLPLHQEYLADAFATGAHARHSSRWLNAASFLATRSQLERLARLDFVTRIDLVNRSRRAAIPEPVGEPSLVSPRAPNEKNASASDIDYGSNLTAMEQANVLPLHEVGLTGKGILVGMLDTGFRTTHEALTHIPVLNTWDFVNNDPNVDEEPDDPAGSRNHGTMTLSTVAAHMPGEMVAPAPNVEVVLGRTEHLTEEIPIEEDNWVAGLEWAESLGADIVSSSLSYFDWYEFSDLDGQTAVTTIAADLAADRGLLVINSAGNNRTSTGTMGAPADGFDVLSVGAVDEAGTVTYFSSPGPTADGRFKPEVAARGLNNTVVHPNDDQAYLSASGTSFSCPLVSGVVALMLERVPQLTPGQIIEALKSTASQPLTPDNDLGWGIVDAWAAATWFGPVIAHDPLADSEDMVGPYVVTAVITDRVGVDPAGLFLNFRVNGGAWSAVSLVPTGASDTYSAGIPGAPAHATVEYYLDAEGTNGFATSLPYQGADGAYRFTTGPWRDISYAESPGEPIPDGVGWGAMSVINVPVVDSGFILEVSVDINVDHPDQGELKVLLTGPGGTEVILHDHSNPGAAHLMGNWTATLTVDGPGSLDDYLDLSNKGDWTLEVIDNIAGNTGTLNSWGLNFTLVRYVTPVEGVLPAMVTRLGPNVPNPFNPRTEISFDLARAGQTRLAIFDVRGMLVRQLIDEDLPAGPHTVRWDGQDHAGLAVASGTYFYRLESGTEIQARKMLLAR